MRNPYNTNELVEPKRYYGKYKAFVRDNVDPEGRGRIRCFCPQVMGPQDYPNAWLGWAETCVPWLGGITVVSSGPPPTKTEQGQEVPVWIEFEDGLVDFPIFVGTFTPAIYKPIDLATSSGAVGGSIISNPPAGSDVGALNPPVPGTPGTPEVRLIVPHGVDLFIMSQDGGTLNVGPAGVDMQGAYVRANGRSVNASPDVVGG